MRTWMIARTVAAASLVTFLPLAGAERGIQPEPFRTGFFGVTAGQTVRLSVVNAGDAKGVIDPCFRVWDADGRLLFEQDAGRVGPGLGTFVDFEPVPDDGMPPSGTPIRLGRAQIRAQVDFLPIPDDGMPPGDPTAFLRALMRDIHVTLEVFDTATGRTVYTSPFAEVAGIEPEPFIPPFAKVAGIDPEPFRTGLFGVTGGQAIRVSILNSGDLGGIINPCVRVWDAAGTLLVETETGPLPGGLGTFVDFVPVPEDGTPPPSGTPLRNGRAQLRAEVDFDSVPEDGLTRGAHVALEVFDTATGKTVFTMPFAEAAGIEPTPFRGRR